MLLIGISLRLRMLINWEIRRGKYAGKNPIVVIKSGQSILERRRKRSFRFLQQQEYDEDNKRCIKTI